MVADRVTIFFLKFKICLHDFLFDILQIDSVKLIQGTIVQDMLGVYGKEPVCSQYTESF